MNIPEPSIERLCLIYSYLEKLETAEYDTISSTDLEKALGIGAPSIRKDISYLGEVGKTKQGYKIEKLKTHISTNLGLVNPKRACIVGLGRLGSAILNYKTVLGKKYEIIAGFDSNINKVETMKVPVELFPAYEIENIVKQKRIELAILAVPPDAAQDIADRLITGGIRGIVNFTPTVITVKEKNVFVRSLDITGELRVLSAYIETKIRKME